MSSIEELAVEIHAEDNGTRSILVAGEPAVSTDNQQDARAYINVLKAEHPGVAMRITYTGADDRIKPIERTFTQHFHDGSHLELPDPILCRHPGAIASRMCYSSKDIKSVSYFPH